MLRYSDIIKYYNKFFNNNFGGADESDNANSKSDLNTILVERDQEDSKNNVEQEETLKDLSKSNAITLASQNASGTSDDSEDLNDKISILRIFIDNLYSILNILKINMSLDNLAIIIKFYNENFYDNSSDLNNSFNEYLNNININKIIIPILNNLNNIFDIFNTINVILTVTKSFDDDTINYINEILIATKEFDNDTINTINAILNKKEKLTTEDTTKINTILKNIINKILGTEISKENEKTLNAFINKNNDKYSDIKNLLGNIKKNKFYYLLNNKDLYTYINGLLNPNTSESSITSTENNLNTKLVERTQEDLNSSQNASGTSDDSEDLNNKVTTLNNFIINLYKKLNEFKENNETILNKIKEIIKSFFINNNNIKIIYLFNNDMKDFNVKRIIYIILNNIYNIYKVFYSFYYINSIYYTLININKVNKTNLYDFITKINKGYYSILLDDTIKKNINIIINKKTVYENDINNIKNILQDFIKIILNNDNIIYLLDDTIKNNINTIIKKEKVDDDDINTINEVLQNYINTILYNNYIDNKNQIILESFIKYTNVKNKYNILLTTIKNNSFYYLINNNLLYNRLVFILYNKLLEEQKNQIKLLEEQKNQIKKSEDQKNQINLKFNILINFISDLYKNLNNDNNNMYIVVLYNIIFYNDNGIFNLFNDYDNDNDNLFINIIYSILNNLNMIYIHIFDKDEKENISQNNEINNDTNQTILEKFNNIEFNNIKYNNIKNLLNKIIELKFYYLLNFNNFYKNIEDVINSNSNITTTLDVSQEQDKDNLVNNKINQIYSNLPNNLNISDDIYNRLTDLYNFIIDLYKNLNEFKENNETILKNLEKIINFYDKDFYDNKVITNNVYNSFDNYAEVTDEYIYYILDILNCMYKVFYSFYYINTIYNELNNISNNIIHKINLFDLINNLYNINIYTNLLDDTIKNNISNIIKKEKVDDDDINNIKYILQNYIKVILSNIDLLYTTNDYEKNIKEYINKKKFSYNDNDLKNINEILQNYINNILNNDYNKKYIEDISKFINIIYNNDKNNIYNILLYKLSKLNCYILSSSDLYKYLQNKVENLKQESEDQIQENHLKDISNNTLFSSERTQKDSEGNTKQEEQKIKPVEQEESQKKLQEQVVKSQNKVEPKQNENLKQESEDQIQEEHSKDMINITLFSSENQNQEEKSDMNLSKQVTQIQKQITQGEKKVKSQASMKKNNNKKIINNNNNEITKNIIFKENTTIIELNVILKTLSDTITSKQSFNVNNDIKDIIKNDIKNIKNIIKEDIKNIKDIKEDIKNIKTINITKIKNIEDILKKIIN